MPSKPDIAAWPAQCFVMPASAPLNHSDGFTPLRLQPLGGVRDKTEAQILASEISHALVSCLRA